MHVLLYFTRRALAINLFARLTYVYVLASQRVINIILTRNEIYMKPV